MAQKLYEESNIQAIADAIRAKNGTTTTYKTNEMAAAIQAITTSGGGSQVFNNVVIKTIIPEEDGQFEIEYTDIPSQSVKEIYFWHYGDIGQNGIEWAMGSYSIHGGIIGQDKGIRIYFDNNYLKLVQGAAGPHIDDGISLITDTTVVKIGTSSNDILLAGETYYLLFVLR